jgi:hypothetical protein
MYLLKGRPLSKLIVQLKIKFPSTDELLKKGYKLSLPDSDYLSNLQQFISKIG